MLMLLLAVSLGIIMMLAIHFSIWKRRQDLSRRYYEGILRRVLEKARANFLRLPNGFTPDGTHTSQIEFVEQCVRKVHGATVSLGLVIADRFYGVRLAEFTKATDELLDAMGVLLSLIKMLAPEADRLKATTYLREQVVAFRNAADALLELFRQ